MLLRARVAPSCTAEHAALSCLPVDDLDQRLARLEERLEQLTSRPPAQKRRDWDAVAAVIASLIGLLALAVSGYTAYLGRQQLRAQMWPRLDLSSSQMDLRFHASNYGTGPARVTAMRVTVDGKPMESWSHVTAAMGYRGQEVIFGALNNRVLPAGKELEIARARDDEVSRAAFKELVGVSPSKHRFGMVVCYCSVLDQCWMDAWGNHDYRIDGDQPIERCPIPDNEEFRN